MRRFPLLPALLVVCSACVLGPLTGVAAAASTDTIFGSAAPTRVDSGDGSAVELGVKFKSSTAGELTGIRFYKASTNTGTHIGNLWSSSGHLLATATFTNETASGWQQVSVANPVAITAGTTYIASYYAPHGHYSSTTGGLSSAVTNAPLQAIGNGTSADGVYAYGSKSAFPTGTYQANNYWVDVMFTPGTTPPPAAPGASFTFSPSAPVTGSGVQFDGTASTCAAGPCTYAWADDPPTGGSWPLGTGQTIGVTFMVVGTKYVTLTVTDALGRSASVEHNVVVTAASINAPPANTALPTVSGVAQQGHTLTTTNGTWTGPPTSYAYQWLDCDSSGNSCVNATGAGSTASSYTLATRDVTHTMRAQVAATNASGSTPATSAQTAVVNAASVPVNTALPVVSGSTVVGNVLSITNGTWTSGGSAALCGGGVITCTYQWQHCAGAVCTNAPGFGATTATYTTAAGAPPSGDVGDTIDVVVTATNSSGSASATSAQSATITSGGAGCPVGTPNVPDGSDPWGGCWPGPTTTGVPAGTSLTTVTTNGETAAQAVAAGAPADNSGWQYVSSDGAIYVTGSNAVVDQISTNTVELLLGGVSVTIKNSSITRAYTSSNQPVTIQHSTLNGGNQTTYDPVDAQIANISYSNLSGGGHEINCQSDVAPCSMTVTNSWLHDNAAIGVSNGAHQNGFFADGTNGDTLTHNTVRCGNAAGGSGNGGCTGDITFLNAGPDQNILVQNNLLLPPYQNICAYPGPDSSTFYATLYNIVWQNNVFARGSNGQCGPSGAVYGWYPSLCNKADGSSYPSNAGNTSCFWIGNKRDDGTALNEPFQ